VKALNSSSSAGAQSHRLTRAARWAGLFAIAALALLLTLYRLGAADVCSYNEAVEGLFVQQIVEHHAGLFPLANGHDAMYKPPLFHWTALAIDRLAGINRVMAFNLRLSAALYAVSCILLTVYFAYTIFGPRAALFAALVLLGSYQYVSQGRFGRVDMTLTFCEALALTAFLWWLRARRADRDDGSAVAWRYLFALALGLGVLAKGPVGALIPLLLIAIFIAVNRYWKLARELFSPGSALLAIGVGLSWYAVCLIRGHYDFLSRQVGSENFGRFFGTLGTMPPWYYVAPLLLNSVPLSLLAPAAVATALIVAVRRPQAQVDIALESAQCLAIFWAVTVAFFTLAAYKRRTYLLPLWPPAAVLIGWWLQKQVPARWRLIAHAGFIAIGIALIALNLVVIPRQEAKTCGQGSFRAAAAQINRIVGSEEPLFIYGMGDPAALLFYLDREAPVLKGELDDAPPGYVIVPAKLWEHDRQRALGLEPILGPTPGSDPLILLRHGKAYAARLLILPSM
jgi:4-amino-4-deoxy-L-arabinose transferase-like glycosyltransferase